MSNYLKRHPEKIALAASLALLAAFLAVPGFEPPDTAAPVVEREAALAHPHLAAPPFSPYRSIEIVSDWDPPAVPAPANDYAFTYVLKRPPVGAIPGWHVPPSVPSVQSVRFVRIDAAPLQVTLEWEPVPQPNAQVTHVLVECRYHGAIDARSFTGSVKPGTHEYRLIPCDGYRRGVPTDWVRVTVPDRWKFTFVLADTTNGIVRIKLEEYGKNGWAPAGEKNYRVGEAIGDSGRTLKAVREVSVTRTRLVCDGSKHFQPRPVTYRVKEIVLSSGDPHRDPAPGWTRDALCRGCMDFLQGIRRSLRLRW